MSNGAQPSRAWYSTRIPEFLSASDESVLGALASNDSGFALVPEQRDAWLEQLEILRSALIGLGGSLFLEFTIPRMGRRIDAVVIEGPVLFVIEFKIGANRIDRAAKEQVWDYALDLKNFHKASHGLAIVPILVASEWDGNARPEFVADHDRVYRPVASNRDGLRKAIDCAMTEISGAGIDHTAWSMAPYRPTPTIIEAARALYAQHSVEAIARFDADAQNLNTTSRRIDDLIDEAMARSQKIICFVTGVPGAGKTLVGLNVATRHRRELHEPTRAVFLSGNGPLVRVLCEALTRDEATRQRKHSKIVGQEQRVDRLGKIRSKVESFIQIVHRFRDDLLASTGAPDEHVAIFDEAQRAWNLKKTANFMLTRKRRPGFSQSEPEFLIGCMDRHKDWAAVICLVGGGQEINTGEAGISEWLNAAKTHFPHWKIYISPNLTDSEYSAGEAINYVRDQPGVELDASLHLAVSMRSFRAETVSAFVKALLDCEHYEAGRLIKDIVSKYPIYVTRDLDAGKKWVKMMARGTERFGLIASSKAQRLKPHAIDIRVDVNPVHWFLHDKDDTRSSYYLEDAATEFQVQGLELDWACVTWDGDLRYSRNGWGFHDFRGDRWTNIHNPENRNYLRNAYRVLLTRARQGMVIFVPLGEATDPTRLPAIYDSTYEYLTDLGIPKLA